MGRSRCDQGRRARGPGLRQLRREIEEHAKRLGELIKEIEAEPARRKPFIKPKLTFGEAAEPLAPGQDLTKTACDRSDCRQPWSGLFCFHGLKHPESPESTPLGHPRKGVLLMAGKAMSSAERRVAIVLHGPPGVGKSQISKELLRRHNPRAKHVSLDDGWLPAQHGTPAEYRYVGGPGRYADLATAPEPILLVEIGCGEPPDLSSPGATRGAQEWIDVLRQAGREVIPFLLWTDWNDAVARLERRYNASLGILFNIWLQVGVYALYEKRHPLVTFPALANFPQEMPVSTANRSIADAADEISRRAGI